MGTAPRRHLSLSRLLKSIKKSPLTLNIALRVQRCMNNVEMYKATTDAFDNWLSFTSKWQQSCQSKAESTFLSQNGLGAFKYESLTLSTPLFVLTFSRVLIYFELLSQLTMIILFEYNLEESKEALTYLH